MTKTPAPDKPKRARKTPYLPALPEGWKYDTVVATGPAGAKVTVKADTGPNHQATVTIEQRDLDRRVQTLPSATQATRALGEAAKVLDGIRKAEAAARKARNEGLDALGKAEEPEEPEDKGDPVAEGPSTNGA